MRDAAVWHGPDDTFLSSTLDAEARAYITSFKWWPTIKRLQMAMAVGGIVGISHTEFTEKIDGTDDELWVVSGVLPSIYMVVVRDDGAQDFLGRYCELIEGCVRPVRGKSTLAAAFPVEAGRGARNRVEEPNRTSSA